MSHKSFWILFVVCLLSFGHKSHLSQAARSPSLIKSVPDIVIGNPQAPLTIIEYSSLTCGHCAQFHVEVLPKLKKKYIDTGKAKLIFRHFPLDARAVQVYALFSQVPLPQQLPLLEKLFKEQNQWHNEKYIEHITRLCGLSKDTAQKALKDKKLEDAILMKRLEAEHAFKIEATPYFIINGRVIDHAPTFEQIDALLSSRS